MQQCQLNQLKRGDRAVVIKIDQTLLNPTATNLNYDLERRILEMGLIEGAKIEILHFGFIKKDPIALRINNNNSILAIRQNDAHIIKVEKIND